MGYAGTDTGWINTTGVSNWSGNITLDAGWYDLHAQVLNGLSVVIGTLTPVEKIGVGDVFIIAGQSLAANTTQASTAALEQSLQKHYKAPMGPWVPGDDPQNDSTNNLPTANNSVWPAFSNTISTHTGYPVGIIDVAVGGTFISQWIPGSNLYPLIQNSVQNLPINGARAIIWDQGESDAQAGVSQSTYTAALTSIIDQSRTDSGWTIPWVIVNTGTFINGSIPGCCRSSSSTKCCSYYISFMF